MRYKVASSSFDKIPLIGNNEFYSLRRNVWNRQNETRSMIGGFDGEEKKNGYSQLISVLIVEKQIDKIIHIVGIIAWYCRKPNCVLGNVHTNGDSQQWISIINKSFCPRFLDCCIRVLNARIKFREE